MQCWNLQRSRAKITYFEKEGNINSISNAGYLKIINYLKEKGELNSPLEGHEKDPVLKKLNKKGKLKHRNARNNFSDTSSGSEDENRPKRSPKRSNTSAKRDRYDSSSDSFDSESEKSERGKRHRSNSTSSESSDYLLLNNVPMHLNGSGSDHGSDKEAYLTNTKCSVRTPLKSTENHKTSSGKSMQPKKTIVISI